VTPFLNEQTNKQTMQANAAQITQTCLSTRDYKMYPWDGPNISMITGHADTTEVEELLYQVKLEAKTNGSVMKADKYLFMSQALNAKLQTQLAAIEGNPAATQQDTAHAMKITTTFHQQEACKERNGEKAAVCIELFKEMVSQAILTHMNTIMQAHVDDPETQLHRICDELRQNFTADPYAIKQSLDAQLSKIGVATKMSDVSLLFTAAQNHEAKAYRLLIWGVTQGLTTVFFSTPRDENTSLRF